MTKLSGTITGFISFVFIALLFTSFDVIGFKHLLNEPFDNGGDLVRVGYYRIMQVSFQIILYALIAYQISFTVSLSAFVFWWFGGCDVLYYPIGKYEIDLKENWNWLWWTPYGFYQLIKYRSKSKVVIITDTVLIQACIGFLISLALIMKW